MIKGLIQKIKDFIKKNPKLTILLVLVFFALYIFVTVEALHFSSVPGFCERCHPEKKTGPLSEVHTWRQNIHAKAEVMCLDCHGEPGFIGYMKAKMGGLRDVYGQFMKSHEHKMEILIKASSEPQYAAHLVPNEICLFCHSDEYNQKIRKERLMSVGVKFRKLDGVKNPEFRKSVGLPDILTEKLRSDIDPNHKKHIDKGVNCIDCHLGVAHGGEFKNKVDMKWCAECHQKRASEISMSDIKIGAGDTSVKFSHKNHTAMFKCDDCHTKLFQMKKGSAKIAFADHKTDNACYSCHNGKKAHFDCNKCHANVPKPTDVLTFGKGDSAVKFKHDIHTSMFKCDECHTKLFQMKKGSAKIAFSDHGKDKACYSCHNNKKASYDCNKCHGKVAAPKQPIVYKTEGMGAVSFSHDFHAAAFGCDQCHTKIWPMQKGAKKMKMDDLYQGKFCGQCHDGKMAAAATDCAKCHK